MNDLALALAVVDAAAVIGARCGKRRVRRAGCTRDDRCQRRLRMTMNDAAANKMRAPLIRRSDNHAVPT